MASGGHQIQNSWFTEICVNASVDLEISFFMSVFKQRFIQIQSFILCFYIQVGHTSIYFVISRWEYLLTLQSWRFKALNLIWMAYWETEKKMYFSMFRLWFVCHHVHNNETCLLLINFEIIRNKTKIIQINFSVF